MRDVVLSPGSRSQALALVAARLEAAGLIRLHVRIDERVAGFTALGLARETRVPVAVVCTSGTAVGNLMPAAMEAHHSGVPVLLLTSDRPPELRGVGANQTTIQPGIFGPFARFAIDAPVPAAVGDGADDDTAGIFAEIADTAFAAAAGEGTRSPGPVQLNLPFREPLTGPLPEGWSPEALEQRAETTSAESEGGDGSGALYQGGGGIGEAGADTAAAAADEGEVLLERGPRTIVVAGAEAGPVAEQLAHDGDWPLVAEIVSGARFGRRVMHGYRALLRDPDLGGRVERVVLVGRPTLSREVTALLSRADLAVIAVRGVAETVNLNGSVVVADRIRIAPLGASPEHVAADERAWLRQWMTASRAHEVDIAPPAPDRDGLASATPAERLGAISAEVAALRTPLDRAALVDAVWRASWPHDRLVFGSSRLVRVADEVLAGKRVPVYANRGVAGIDGTIATATGVALASQADGSPGVTRVVLGDLALLHDIGALLLPPSEHEPRLQVIVGNDRGGTIFDGLEVASVAPRDDLDRVLYTPHDVRLDHLALAYGWEYHRPTTRAALDQLLTAPVGGRQLIEVPLPR